MQLPLLSEFAALEKSALRLRPYQQRIAEQGLSLLAQGKSPLSEAATGTGKTVTAVEVIRQFKGRVLWVAHRIELVRQAKKALEAFLGETIDEESPGLYSSSARIVVASKDTVRTARRLARLSVYGSFDLVVIDECHHSPAKSYQAIVEAFPQALRYGMTATPGRLDKKALKLFDARTDAYGIIEATRDNWLVPIVAKRAKVKTIDVSGITTQAGDFTPGELRELLASEVNLQAMARVMLDECGARPTLAYAVSVDVAKKLAELINRVKPGAARSVDGETSEMVRAALFSEFGQTYQFLFNCEVATEGTDLPVASCIAMCRPTKSDSLFKQMLGRGLRPWPGIDSANDRAAWMRDSAKPDCLVLDFVGNTGKHSVATAAWAYTDDQEVIAAVNKGMNEGVTDKTGITVAELVEKETARIAKLRAIRSTAKDKRKTLQIANVTTEMMDVALIGMGGDEWIETQDLTGAITPGQQEEMKRLGIAGTYIETAAEARRVIISVRKLRNLASGKQLDFIRKHAPDKLKPDMTKKHAGFIIDSLIRGWNRHRKFNRFARSVE